jgi:hypothetical protein
MALNPATTTTIATGIPIPSGASASQAAYITKIWPYVQRESLRTGIPPEVFIIQSGRETGWGSSWLFRVGNNPAGIGAFDSSHGAQFASLSDGFATYADRLMGKGEGGQGPFVADVRAGASAATLLDDLQRGPWAGGHYDFGAGKGLTANLASLYGGAGSSATKGTGGLSGAPGQSADTQGNVISDVGSAALKGVLGPLGGVLGLIPGVNALKAADTFFGLVVNVFLNWRYMLELLAGGVLVLGGVAIIVADTGRKNPQIIQALGAAAV